MKVFRGSDFGSQLQESKRQHLGPFDDIIKVVHFVNVFRQSWFGGSPATSAAGYTGCFLQFPSREMTPVREVICP